MSILGPADLNQGDSVGNILHLFDVYNIVLTSLFGSTFGRESWEFQVGPKKTE